MPAPRHFASSVVHSSNGFLGILHHETREANPKGTMTEMLKPVLAIVLLNLAFGPGLLPLRAQVVEIRPVVLEQDGGQHVEYWSGNLRVGRSTETAPAGVQLKLPGAEWAPVRFRPQAELDGAVELGRAKVGALTLRWQLMQKTPSLVQRTLEVRADSAQQFSVAFPFDAAMEGEHASFSGPATNRVLCDTVRGAARTETFPVAMVRTAGKVFGIVADSPGLWENRCQGLLDPPARRLAILTGDGRDPYSLVIKPPEDARDTYQYFADRHLRQRRVLYNFDGDSCLWTRRGSTRSD